jgi:Capsule assembly protein Wzi
MKVFKKFSFLKTFLLFVILLSTDVFLHAQVVYEPLYEDVYNFLGRVSQKGIIEFDDLIRPLPRKYISDKLLEADSLSSQLTSLERDELEFFLKDFFHERWLSEGNNKQTEHLDYFGYDPSDRWRMFSYGGDGFKLNADLILGAEVGYVKDAKQTHFWNGLYSYGYIYDVLGFSFDFRDNTESGTTLDKTKSFTPETGVNARTDLNTYEYSPDKMEYSEAKMMLATDWKWGSLAAGKEFIEWGYGDNGLLVMSQKAPSFPLIRLDINPVEWLSFNYFHAWLSSDVVDTTSLYPTDNGDYRFLFRDKYLASHTLTIKPTRGLDLSIGESIIYADQLEFLYLIPITFFRLADHYLSRQANSAGSNAQIFFSISSKGHIKNTHLYGTLLIDELTINGLFDPEEQRNQIGFTLGSSLTDLPFDNLTLKLEYSKIYPYVYQHYINTTTYESASYVLGHWMNNNADQIFGSLKYRFIRGLETEIWARYIRQGERADESQQFVQPQPPFLFGLRTNYTYLGGQIKFEIIHDLFARANYQYMKTSKQQEDLSFVDDSNQEFYFAVYYGL